MVINYPRDVLDANPIASQWTVKHALDIAGTPDNAKEIILNFWRAPEYDGMRWTFNSWNAYMQSIHRNGQGEDGSASLLNMMMSYVHSDTLL